MRKTSGKPKMKKEQLIFYIVMIALPVLQILIFYFGVNFNSILLAFKSYGENGTIHFAGFDNFKQVFYDLFNDVQWQFAMKNSLIVYAVLTLVNTSLALLFAYYIYKNRFASKFFRVILYMPSIVSSIVMVILYKYFVDTFIPQIILKITHEQAEGLLSNPDTTMLMLMIYSIITGFGTNVLLLSGAMSSVNESLIEAARIDGAGPVKQFFSVVLPQIWPTLVTLLITGVATLFGNQFNLYSLYGVNAEMQYVTVGYLLFKYTSKASDFEYPYLAAFGLILTVIIVPLTLIIRKILNKVGPSDD